MMVTGMHSHWLAGGLPLLPVSPRLVNRRRQASHCPPGICCAPLPMRKKEGRGSKKSVSCVVAITMSGG